ncbi:maleylacetate reductase [Microvirga sp. BT688]|uniref:maleylacetate reductase n=1 Tax=Microvirga sp. TaxID=1873136 RepID=UPI001689C4E4|nr:maleylacetate reductase [Microvirga sp.]MBD2751232.1 maleylacetate reductase [Microvirga sp.]
MQSFVYDALPARVVFGSGTIAQLRSEVERLDVNQVLVLSTPGRGEAQAREIAGILGELSVGVYPGAVMHTPVAATEQALQVVKDQNADAIVAVGGGSTIGLGKAIALRTNLPQLVIPTTYAGSEMTPILGETKDGVKTTQRTLKVLPEVTIYDVDLTLSLPAAIAATSGMNAMAHAVEALYAQDRNPVISLMAEEGIRSLAGALPRITEAPQDHMARSDALYGAWLCGTCLGAVGMALHHKLCHVLGGAFNLPHAETHTIVLPHAVAYNAPAVPDAMGRIARAMGAADAAQGLFELAKRLGAKQALRDIGMPEEGIEQAVKATLAAPYWNPRPLDEAALRHLLTRVWNGDPPLA